MEVSRLPAPIRALITASRNAAAQKRKSAAVLASLACGVMALCLVGGYYEYSYWGLAQSLIHSQYGHLELYAKGYRASRDLDPFAKPIPEPERILAALRADPEVAAAAPRAYALAAATGPGGTAVVEARGVDPEEEASIFTFTTSKRGGWLSRRDRGACQISPAMAAQLGVSLGDSVLLRGTTVDNQLNEIPLKVKAIAGSYSQEFDGLALTMTAADFEDLFGRAGVHEIAVLLKDGVSPERKARSLTAAIAGNGIAGDALEVSIWYEQAAYFRQVLEYFQGFYRLVLLLSAFLAFMVAAATINLAVEERKKEFGTRLALGEPRAAVAGSVLLEAFILGLAGLALGGALSWAAASIIDAAGGILMPAAPGLTTALRVRILWSPQGAWLSVLDCLAVPLLAALAPAWRMSRSSVVSLLVKRTRA